MKNLSFECGSVDFRIWDKNVQDFGQCFFHLGIQLPCYALLAIVSSYYIGKRRLVFSQPSDWNNCQTFIIYFRSLLVSLLTITSLIQMLIHFVLKSHLISVTEIAISTSKTGAWFLHLIFVLRLKRGNSFNTRGPKLILMTWFSSAVVSAFSFRTRYYFFVNRHYHNNYNQQQLHDYLNYGDEAETTQLFNYPADDYLWLCTSAIEIILQFFYLLTLIPGSSHLEQHQYRHRSRVNDVVYSAYEGHENNSYTGFDEDDEEEIPLGTAKERSGIISRLFFIWVTKLMKKGSCGFLKAAENLFDLPLDLSTRHVALNFQRWTVTRTLLKSLHVSFGFEFYSVGLLKLISDAMGFCGPIFLSYLVKFIEDGSESQEIWVGYGYVGGLCAAAIIGALANTHFNMKMAEINLKIRAALITTIYRKTVHIRKTTLDKFSSGEILNFFSTDTDRIVNFCPSFHAFWSLPAQVGVTLYLLYREIDLSFLAGLIFAIVLIPVNRVIAKKIGQLSTEMMKYKDQRVKMMSEILYGARTLKLHSWETYFFERVNDIRCKEMKCLKGRKYLDALCVYFWATTPIMISVLSFGTYVMLGNQLTASKVFTSIALFNILINPLNSLPWVLNGLVEAWVSIKRINKFLQEEETEPYAVFDELPTMMKESTAILAEQASFNWGAGELSISDLNLKVSKGQFIGIIGGVGSGKSSVLLSILGELNKSSGSISVPNPNEGIGLVLQEAWVQRGTIRSNICFAPNTNLTRYKSVVESCCLKEDLSSFKYRDDTIVGENGTCLSGGQKIRLTLARAVYQDFNTYFLDDVFAAVDYKVAKQLYRKCIMGILKNKTRLLCTHHTQFLKDADWIIVLNEGNIIDEGTPSQILPRYGDNSIENSISDSESDLDERRGDSFTKRRLDITRTPSEMDETVMIKSGHSFEFTHNGQVPVEDQDGCDLNEETQREGTIQFHVFTSYYKAIGPCLFWSIIISIIIMQASRNFSDIWLAYWVSQQKDNNGTELPTTTTTPFPTFETPLNSYLNARSSENFLQDSNEDQQQYYSSFIIELIPFNTDHMDPTIKYYFGIFILIGLFNSVFTLARAFLFAIGGIVFNYKIYI
ncbi:Multidrug resistance-associated protein 7 [Folsomia candida]|uniref:ABC-type xenobiotic transporter n=1 Tax=Folsomia candida TaxID=158441 RepID=A0A226ERA2_FOLCA|nr:Multidrug resistance-associated protein 7 [Folsomia candida]